jgi:hypothetical protein
MIARPGVAGVLHRLGASLTYSKGVVSIMGRKRLNRDGLAQLGCEAYVALCVCHWLNTKRVYGDILTQGLIGLIEYSYHQGIPSFLKAHPAKNSRVKRACPREILGWVTVRKVFLGVHK